MSVKDIVEECGDVARERWRFYYDRALGNCSSTSVAIEDADASVIAEYERGVLVPSKHVAATRKAVVFAEGVFMHASSDGEIDRGVLAKFVSEFAKIKRDLS